MSLVALVLVAAIEFKPFTLPLRDGTKLEAEVATLSVPGRRAVAGSPPFDLAVMRLRSTSDTPGDPIVWLAGGPGNAATSMATSRIVTAMRTHGDVLLMDQRGTGRSTPSPACDPIAPPPDVYFADEKATLAGAVEYLRDCVKDRGVDLRAFSTEEAADDVEALRAALGAPKIRLIGYSYGTHLGLSVLRRHGERISQAVFIGTEGPDDTYKLPETYDLQLFRLSRLATGSDALVRAYERIAAKLEKEPLEIPVVLKEGDAPVSVRVSRTGFERIIVQDLGDSADFVLFPAMFEMLERGDTTLFARYVEKRYRPVTRGARLMSLATDCASHASPERLAAIARQERTSRFRSVNYPFPGICAAFDALDLGDAFRAPVVSAVPTLFVSGTLDVNTPPYQAERVAWGFSDARHLVVVHAGHEEMDSNPDVMARIATFLGGTAMKNETIELPRPRFLSVEEAKERVP
jgi:pimeloyl-ACP methyl ester carboxylesterase